MSKGRNKLLREIGGLPGIEVGNGPKHIKVYWLGKLVLVLSHGARAGKDDNEMAWARRKLRKEGVPLDA